MFEEVGEYTLCEFEVIEPVKDFGTVDYGSSSSDEPILLHVHDAYPPLSPISLPCSPCSPRSPNSPCFPGSPSPYSPCSSSPYSFLSAPSSGPSSSPSRSCPRRGRILCAPDFHPLRILGRGGNGTVYLVEDAVSGRHLAMKVIAKNGLRLREYPAVFEEQAVGRALMESGGGGGGESSPGCVPLLGSFEDSDNFYFLTEYYPRGDLMHEVKRRGALSILQTRIWCAELLVALEHLHSRRIIHRDIKLDNILLDGEGHIALSDFGIARTFGGTGADRPWKQLAPWRHSVENDNAEGEEENREGTDGNDGGDKTHSLVGTPGYAAPEVYSGKYSYGADIWGAGVVLYSMLMGKLPFGLLPKEQRLEELIARTDSIPADFDLDGFVDEDTRDLLMKMLEKDPGRRPSIHKLKKHRWFRGIKWNVIERRKPYRHDCEQQPGPSQAQEEAIYIPYGRPYGALDQPPHEWFDWVSPVLREDEDSWDTSNDWSLGSTCYWEHDMDQSEEGIGSAVTDLWKRRNVVQRMKGWLRRRMSSP